MNILIFSGSLRTGSLNRKLVAVASQIAAILPDMKSQIVDLKPLALPVYDGDIETQGIPEGVKKLGEEVARAHALILSSPEYNGSIAGSFKNTIDWLSRLRPVPLEKKPILLMGASPGGFGAIRGLGFGRAPFETLGAFVYPQTFALPRAHEAFAPNGDLVDTATREKLAKLIADFTNFAKKLNG